MSGTAVALAALKSTAFKSEPRAGQRAERRALEFLEEQGYEPWLANHKICGVEIDLVMRDRSGAYCLIEVKTLRSEDYIERRVTPSQIRRIRHVLQRMLEIFPGTRAHLVWVEENRMRLWEDFFVWDL